MQPTELRVPSELMLHTCPRCGEQAETRFYGPCPACCEQLRATMGGDERQVEVAAYEPKMNVTPNAVALKE